MSSTAPGLRRDRVSMSKVEKLEDTLLTAHQLIREIVRKTDALGEAQIESADYVNKKQELNLQLMEARKFLVANPTATSLLCLAPIVQVVEAANELVLADNGCTLGRDGCESRWDSAMNGLKNTLRKIKFDD